MSQFHVCGISERIAEETARHMTQFVVAASRRLVLLRALEWSGTKGRGVEEDPARSCCPWCHNDREQGHDNTCELAEEVAK